MQNDLSTEKLREYRLFAEELAREAGAMARTVAQDGLNVREKSENDPVTLVDERVNSMVIERVRRTYPDIAVLGEEESSQTDNGGTLLWVCDPLDGTIPFVLGIPISTFCLALVQDGKPIVGVVYDFANDRLYSAAAGLGATCNGQSMPKGGSDMVSPLNIVPVEWWHSAANDVSEIIAKLQTARYQTPNFSSFGYTCMLVATGRIKGAVYAGDKPWDVAAAKVILEDVGMKVTTIDNQDQKYDTAIRGAIVSSDAIHKALFD